MNPVQIRRSAAQSVQRAVLLALMAGCACEPSLAQPCQAAPPQRPTLDIASHLYADARFDMAAGAYAAIARADDADVSSRLAAMAGWERGLKAQACDREALAVQRDRLALAEQFGDAEAARDSMARIARLSVTRDSSGAEAMARQVTGDDPSRTAPDDAASDALTTLAILAVARGDRESASALLAAALRRATSALRLSEAWRTLGMLRQSERGSANADGAREAFRKALATARAANDPEASALASIFLAGTETEPAAAQALRDAARTTAQAGHMRRVEAVADQQAAFALRTAATYSERVHRAELLERAAARFAEIGDESQERNVRLDLASCLYALGDTARASVAVGRAAQLAQALGYAVEVAKAEHLVGLLAMEQPIPDLGLARKHLQRALEVAQESPDLAERGRVLHDIAVVELTDGNHDQALDDLLQAEQLAERSGQADALALREQLWVTLGWTLADAGRAKEAVAPLWLASAARTSSETRGQAWWGLARLNADREPEAAQVFYERALRDIGPLQPRGAQLPATARAVFMSRYSSLYRELAVLLLRLKQPARAQYVAGLMQQMELVEAHWAPSRGAGDASAPRDGAANITQCESALQQRETEYFHAWSSTRASYKTLGSCCIRSPDGSTCPGPQGAAQTACHALAILAAEGQELGAEEGDCVKTLAAAAAVASSDSTFAIQRDYPDRWAKAVGGSATLVVTLLTPRELHVLIRSPGTAGFVTHTRSVAPGEVAELVQRWINEREWAAKTSRELQRQGISPQHAADLRKQLESRSEMLKAGLLRDLYRLVLEDAALFMQAPAAGEARPYLAIALDGPLRELPVAALFDGQHYLGERAAIALLTSTTLDPRDLRDMPVGPPLVLGMSALATPALPAVAGEVHEVGRVLGTTPLLDGEATRAHVFGWLDDLFARQTAADVLHIAAHGKSGGTSTSTVISLADADLTGAEFIQARDQLGQVRLVVLSACESAGYGQGELALGLAGIAQQGARSVIGSLWEVDDHATADLMATFYQQWKQSGMKSVSRALAAAQDHVRAQYPHPYYWAAFAAIGRWD